MIKGSLISWLLTLSFIVISNSYIAQNDTINSIGFKNLPDTTKIRILIEISDSCEISEILTYTDRALIIGKRIGAKNPNSKYIEYYASAFNNAAFYYDQVGQIKEALSNYIKALEIRESIKDSLGIGESYNNLGYLLQQQGDLEIAKDYYHRAEKIFNELHYEMGLVNIYINMGYTYYLDNKVDSSELFFEKGLELSEKIGDTKGASYALNNLASIYESQGKHDLSELTYLRSLKLREQLGIKDGIARSHYNLGRFYFKRRKFKKSEFHANASYNLALELQSPDVINMSAGLLSDIYNDQKNYKKALEYLIIHIEMKDSILSDETQKIAIKQQLEYEYDKKKDLDDIAHKNQLVISAEQEQKQKVITYFIGGGLALVILFSIFIFNRLQITRKQKVVIEEQKQEVEHQKILVEEKNQEITDSITYAKRIQSAILPPEKVVKEYLKESFILYIPKDIVAGDFYWMEHVGEKILFAAADCTGHGVPGAMVSVVCNNALNRSVREFGLTDPGKILDKTREIVIQEFEQSAEEVKDGMDIALCCLEGTKLAYAGAHNPLWIIRGGEIIETKADKQPIGEFDNLLSYRTHQFELEKGDSIYIFSDGFVDQFGGEKGKKFKTKAFRELLLGIQTNSMEEQKRVIESTFETWKGDVEQIDDVCVIGVKI